MEIIEQFRSKERRQSHDTIAFIDCLLVGTCHLLITFANNLDADQVRQHIGPDLGPECLRL